MAILHVIMDLCVRRGWPLPTAEGRDAFFASFAAASRRAGKQPLSLRSDEVTRLAAAGVDWPFVTRTDELWRVAMLVGAAYDSAFQDGFVGFVADVFRAGDNDERRAVLRALPLLPEPERFAPLAIDACRTNVVPIFEAIACENPFPARCFPDLHFHQLVLKAVFLGVSLPRVLGLAERVTPELERMAGDYADERRAAGRAVPDDLALLISRRDRA